MRLERFGCNVRYDCTLHHMTARTVVRLERFEAERRQARRARDELEQPRALLGCEAADDVPEPLEVVMRRDRHTGERSRARAGRREEKGGGRRREEKGGEGRREKGEGKRKKEVEERRKRRGRNEKDKDITKWTMTDHR